MTTKLEALFDLAGKVAIITGGSRGLGLQIAEALGEYGAWVVLVARKQSELDKAVAQLRGNGIEAQGICTDLTSPNAVVALVTGVLDELGHIDILVNNAGTTWGAAAEHYPVANWSKVLDLNVTAMFLLTQAVAKAAFLPQGKGVVINMASILGLIGTPDWQIGTVAYNSAKGAVLSMTRALAAEWGPRGIRVNALAPGFFPSKMTQATLNATGDKMIALTPLGRLGDDADMKGPALLLASDAGRHITGQVIVVDGGMSII